LHWSGCLYKNEVRALFLSLVLFPACFVERAEADTQIRFANAPAELTISEISEHTVRLELTPLDEQGKTGAPPPSTVLVRFASKERFRARSLSRTTEVRAGRLRLQVQPSPLAVSIRRADGSLVQQLTFESGTNGAIAFRTEAPVLGLGEGEQQFDRRGKLYRMVNGQLSPMLATHGATIPVPLILGTDGWALFVHRPWGEVDLRETTGRLLPSTRTETKEGLDLFVIDAPQPAEALSEYARLIGHAVMPPKWTLGYIQSHRTLAGPEEPVQVARTFREKQLPCDALIYLGTGYCTNGWNTGHGSLEFNPRAFDQPARQIEALHALNFKIIFHINHAPRNMFGGSISEDSDSPLHISNYWARHRPVMALGADGWWPDDGDELPVEARLARHRCYYEGALRDWPNLRPWSLHRNGYAGVARYGGWIWSGDTQSRWATLAAHVPVALNYSLSLTPFWGSDTGGFVPTRELTGELYTRWFQFSAFNPLFRSHGRTWHLRVPWGWNAGEFGPIEANSGPDPAELHNAEVEPICRKYLELRYRLLPYNYALFREACDTGLPPMRALWLHHPRDEQAVRLGDEYLWGRDILVAPVVEKEAHSRRVYLPAGTWYDWWTNEKVAGPAWTDRPVDLATLPLYVRAGAIIPLDPIRQYTTQPITEPTTLKVYPGADGSFTLYDDDGTSLDYQRNLATWTRVHWNDHERTLRMEPDPRSKARSTESRTFEIVLMTDGRRQELVYRGRRVDVKL
jgi:alpha-glucosidase/alpha-D-xyloside xylohydrolase